MRNYAVMACALFAFTATNAAAENWLMAPGASFILYDRDSAYVEAKTQLLYVNTCFAGPEKQCSGAKDDMMLERLDCAHSTMALYFRETKKLPGGWQAAKPLDPDTEGGATMTALCSTAASLPTR
ncbi:MAG: hypothetical protein KGI68_04350 [Alphaproteobacteria bacterium]|nr:hypothetical protein [Alphaproteobacteria bacterium]MDE1987439.1 hypothetical protein [Alphaproteobacteria bacterium]MDE2500560.1 hypothetical protein [Alphaproteobacteria bacterium]